MADVQILAAGGHAAPLDYVLNNLTELIPKACRAVFDGSAAVTAFQPCLVFTSGSGDEIARIPVTPPVAAGGSAEVSWFPRVGGGTTAVFPPPPGPGFLIYQYEVSGVAKSSIDTAVDGAFAGAFVTSLNILEVWMIVRTTGFTGAAYHENVLININGDNGANYDVNYIYGHGGLITSNNGLGSTSWAVDGHGVGGTANAPALISMTFPGYAQTEFFKVGYVSTDLYDLSVADSFWTLRESMGWRSTAPITRLQFQPQGVGDKFDIGTTVMIYGR